MRCLQTQTTRRKLTTLCQGDSSMEELIWEFKIHGSISRLGNVGLVNHFEQVIHLQLCHGTTSLPLLHPPLATSDLICLHSTSSASALLQLQCALVQLV